MNASYPPDCFFLIMEAGIVHLVKLGKIHYNFDFAKYSLVPLEGYRTW